MALAQLRSPFSLLVVFAVIMHRLRAILCNLLQVCFEIEFRILWVRYHWKDLISVSKREKSSTYSASYRHRLSAARSALQTSTLRLLSA